MIACIFDMAKVERKHNPECGLCRTNHPLMTYACAAAALGLAEITVRMRTGGTSHLRHFKQGARVHLIRAQVLEHRRTGMLNGECKPEDGKPAPCERVFEEM